MLNTQEKNVIESLADIIPRLPSDKRLYLLGIGEGMAIMSDKQKEKDKVTA